MMKVLVLTGMPGSGKSTAVEVAKARGVPVLRMGDDVVDEVRSRGLPDDRTNVGRIASEMRESHGPAIWAVRTIERVRGGEVGKAPIIIIDGCRSTAELDAFREAFGTDLLVLAITASEGTRFERLKERGRPDDITTIEELRERDSSELGWGLGEVMAAADITIENEGPVEDVQRRISEALDRLR